MNLSHEKEIIDTRSNLLWAEHRLANIKSSQDEYIRLKLEKHRAIEIFRYYIFQLRDIEKGQPIA